MRSHTTYGNNPAYRASLLAGEISPCTLPALAWWNIAALPRFCTYGSCATACCDLPVSGRLCSICPLITGISWVCGFAHWPFGEEDHRKKGEGTDCFCPLSLSHVLHLLLTQTGKQMEISCGTLKSYPLVLLHPSRSHPVQYHSVLRFSSTLIASVPFPPAHTCAAC